MSDILRPLLTQLAASGEKGRQNYWGLEQWQWELMDSTAAPGMLLLSGFTNLLYSAAVMEPPSLRQ